MNALSDRLSTIKDFLATQHWPTSADFKNLFNWNYYTTYPIPPESPYTLLLATIIVLILAALVVWYIRLYQLHKKTAIYGLLLDQLPTLIIFIIIISVAYAFCWTQSVQYLSSRLVLLATFIVALGWVAYLIIYTVRFLPARKLAHLEKERFFRYLPKKKKNA